jgi:uncharacterized protein YeaO (DUF488 family)
MADVIVARLGDPLEPGRYRVLVDRLWPRGIAKASRAWDEWLKDVAPSTALRRWYGHDPARFTEFRARYWAELDDNAAPALVRLLKLAEAGPVALLTATRDPATSQAAVLREWLLARLDGAGA